MGDVLITYKMMPEEPGTPLQPIKEEIESKVKDLCTRSAIEEEPIGFGIVALIVKVVMPDRTGKPEDLEAALNTVSGIQSVESTGIGLL